MITVRSFPTGYLQTNCYLVDDGTECVVLDPGGGYDTIIKMLGERNLHLSAVLLTHGHFDHILALPRLAADGAKVYIHVADEKMLQGEWSLAEDMGLPPIPAVKADVILNGGEAVTIGEMTFSVIHTPGHTQGSCCYELEGKYLFSGDTLFCGSYGRTDFYGGDTRALVASIKKLFALSGDRIVYPGHGESTTLAYERDYNPISAML